MSLFTIAGNTLKEARRDRVLHVLLLFACLLTFVGTLLGSLSIAQDVRILADIGLLAICTIGGIIAILLGSTLVTQEIEQRTIDLVITKPVARWQFVCGKFMGLSGYLALSLVFMGTFLLVVIYFTMPDKAAFEILSGAVSLSLFLIYAELLLILSLALCFSTFASPLMTVAFTLSFWLIAHGTTSLLALGEMSTSASTSWLATALYYSLPDLSAVTRSQDELMRWYEVTRHARLEGVQLPFELTALRALPMVLTYIFGYILLLLSIGTYVVERREFT
jgi:ABC-type transport system involved in multi-copper enzyme maturation permease subunit